MERPEHEVEARERLVVHVQAAVGERVDLDRAKDAERVAVVLEPTIDGVDRPALFSELFRCHPVRDRERLGMVRDRHVGPAEGPRRRDHVVKRQTAVAEGGVHLEVGARVRLPLRIGIERPPDFGIGEEPASRLLRLRHRRRIVEPRVDLRRHPRSDGGKLREGTAGIDELVRLFRPEPRRSGRSLQRPSAMAGLFAPGVPEQLADVGVRQHPSGHLVRYADPNHGSEARAEGRSSI